MKKYFAVIIFVFCCYIYFNQMNVILHASEDIKATLKCCNNIKRRVTDLEKLIGSHEDCEGYNDNKNPIFKLNSIFKLICNNIKTIEENKKSIKILKNNYKYSIKGKTIIREDFSGNSETVYSGDKRPEDVVCFKNYVICIIDNKLYLSETGLYLDKEGKETVQFGKLKNGNPKHIAVLDNYIYVAYDMKPGTGKYKTFVNEYYIKSPKNIKMTNVVTSGHKFSSFEVFNIQSYNKNRTRKGVKVFLVNRDPYFVTYEKNKYD